MNEINKDEIFAQLKGFLKSKGIEVQDGSYADGIRKGCDILTDTVNLSQRAIVRAKDAMDKGIDQVRQTVHERTAPKQKAKTKSTTANDSNSRPKSGSKKKASAKKSTAPRGKKKRK